MNRRSFLAGIASITIAKSALADGIALNSMAHPGWTHQYYLPDPCLEIVRLPEYTYSQACRNALADSARLSRERMAADFLMRDHNAE